MDMKAKLLSVTALIILLLPLACVQAIWDWSGTSINSGYAVTTDWHGIEVPIGETVTAWAGTTDISIIKVVFRWLRPDKTVAGTFVVLWDPPNSTSEGSWNGDPVREFKNSYIPDVLGDWGVQAIFYDTGGHGVGPVPGDDGEKVAIRARSFFTVPEVPFGTIASLAAMLGALSVFTLKRRHNPRQ